jgi:hypothetical protein
MDGAFIATKQFERGDAKESVITAHEKMAFCSRAG